jgi:hypothetical protein
VDQLVDENFQFRTYLLCSGDGDNKVTENVPQKHLEQHPSQCLSIGVGLDNIFDGETKITKLIM